MITDKLHGMLDKFKIAGLLRQVHFPITKPELVEYAEEHNAPEKVVQVLEKLPDKVYQSASHVLENLRGQQA